MSGQAWAYFAQGHKGRTWTQVLREWCKHCSCSMLILYPSPPNPPAPLPRLLLAGEHHNVFQGVTVSRILPVWERLRPVGWCSTFFQLPLLNPPKWLLYFMASGKGLNVTVYKNQKYLLYEKQDRMAKNLLISLCFHIIAVLCKRSCILCMLR